MRVKYYFTIGLNTKIHNWHKRYEQYFIITCQIFTWHCAPPPPSPWHQQVEALGDSKEKVLVFFKLHPSVITEDNLHQSLLVSSMLESPISTLYQAVRQVFAPVLLQVSPSTCTCKNSILERSISWRNALHANILNKNIKCLEYVCFGCFSAATIPTFCSMSLNRLSYSHFCGC